MQDFIIAPASKIIDALRKIDSNKNGFLVVVDDEGNLLGTLTDGDIRRAFISGKSSSDKIDEIYSNECKSLNLGDGLGKAIEIFKSPNINFLPITNNGKLVNIITKKQLHTVLLQNMVVNLDYDFCLLDTDIIDYEIFPRPWGFYKTIVMNEFFQSKIICVSPNSKLSLQSHSKRQEHWVVAYGSGGIVQIGESVISAKVGDNFFIPKGCKHRLQNNSSDENLIIIELQIGEYFGEDDIIRYEDDYGRS